MSYDVIIIGGSYSGLAAGLQLARARRRILVIDAGMRRNRFAAASHGFLTQDGTPAADIAAKARSQLMAYDTVEWVSGHATDAQATPQGFRVAIGAEERQETGQRLILALGIKDELPAVPGLEERWGKSVFHCPYCHGYELDRGRIGVLATSPKSIHHALMLPDWGSTTFFLNDVFTPDPEQLEQLRRRGVVIDDGTVERLDGEGATIVMRDGRIVPLDGLFVMPRTSIASPIAEELGCAFDEGATGPVIRTDAMKATSVAGVFACGDAARMAGSVTFAVADGAMAGTAAHQSLMFAG
ncbi:NAD(P)/FAD-dependent oxidoreductase [Microvirga sp. BSC39]|uniref:NAD(P)/FAD-dependent oxidoreductase n=1 Tax=Microvirga sp. BSC39 TaxID=1549810 RepID=UPI0004E8C7E2|nr:NAD(P)/FAD-dependent oxidoreductase [Microvirga sp. BSC39]KFG66795.1 thioredoxin reductase [Microvirga sp. BSC39]